MMKLSQILLFSFLVLVFLPSSECKRRKRHSFHSHKSKGGVLTDEKRTARLKSYELNCPKHGVLLDDHLNADSEAECKELFGTFLENPHDLSNQSVVPQKEEKEEHKEI